jgi:hypothetical protein
MRIVHFAVRRAVFAAVLTLQGCAAAASFRDTRMPGAPVTFSRLYIYSFLDITDDALGSSLRRELSRQLAAELESRGVSSEQHSFSDSRIAGEFPRLRDQEWRMDTIPVGRVILQNAANERRFGAEYRLVAFPTQTRVVGSERTYDIRWGNPGCAGFANGVEHYIPIAAHELDQQGRERWRTRQGNCGRSYFRDDVVRSAPLICTARTELSLSRNRGRGCCRGREAL